MNENKINTESNPNIFLSDNQNITQNQELQPQTQDPNMMQTQYPNMLQQEPIENPEEQPMDESINETTEQHQMDESINPSIEQHQMDESINETTGEQPMDESINETTGEQPMDESINETTGEQPMDESTEPEQILQELSTREKNIRSKVLNKKPPCEMKQKESSSPYTEKVQIKNELTATEQELSELLKTNHQKIKSFLYFQPLIETTPLSMGTINQEDLNNCEDEDILRPAENQENKELILCKYKKIGKKQFLQEYLKTKTQDIKQKNVFIQVLAHSHLQLLDSISKLQSIEPPIIHFYLTNENILYDDMNATPVITDFRMGFTKDKLYIPEKMENLFPEYEDSDVWPIEVFFISKLLNHSTSNATNTESTENEQEQVASQNQTELIFTEQMATDFIQTYTQMSLFSNSPSLQNKKDEFTTNMQMYFQPLFNKPNKEVLNTLKQTVLSWDVFSLTTVFLTILRELNVESMKETHEFIKRYAVVLEEYILFDPMKRPSIETVIQKIQAVFQSISMEEYNTFVDNLQEQSTS